ncbi:MAG: response regulator [Bdellovibrionales bacterium]|nr:response regulator [Bdellovibrionales bacterium]
MNTLTDDHSNMALSLLYEMPKPVKVLVVEDDRIQWPLWESILKSAYSDVEIDWETTEAGAEALLRHAYQNNSPYNLVISDIFLEGRDTGIDLWNRYGEAAYNFVFVSGLTTKNFDALMSTMSNLQGGGPYYLEKPITPRMGKEVLKNLTIRKGEIA